MLSEKVDTTLSKGILRVGGTVVGGSLGERLSSALWCLPSATLPPHMDSICAPLCGLNLVMYMRVLSPRWLTRMRLSSGLRCGSVLVSTRVFI